MTTTAMIFTLLGVGFVTAKVMEFAFWLDSPRRRTAR